MVSAIPLHVGKLQVSAPEAEVAQEPLHVGTGWNSNQACGLSPVRGKLSPPSLRISFPVPADLPTGEGTPGYGSLSSPPAPSQGPSL